MQETKCNQGAIRRCRVGRGDLARTSVGAQSHPADSGRFVRPFVAISSASGAVVGDRGDCHVLGGRESADAYNVLCLSSTARIRGRTAARRFFSRQNSFGADSSSGAKRRNAAGAWLAVVALQATFT
uniref:Uncharacterized protein n=1 Tax=Plectus sambesii TaxID=2011161 RepID=A0A914VEH0_9BILA